MPKITVDKEKCIACGTCYSMYPELFKEAEEGKSEVIAHDYKKHGYSKDEIVGNCSGEAISIEE